MCRQDGLDELLAESEGRKARSVLKVEAAGRNVLTSEGRRPERADKPPKGRRAARRLRRRARVAQR